MARVKKRWPAAPIILSTIHTTRKNVPKFHASLSRSQEGAFGLFPAVKHHWTLSRSVSIPHESRVGTEWAVECGRGGGEGPKRAPSTGRVPPLLLLSSFSSSSSSSSSLPRILPPGDHRGETRPLIITIIFRNSHLWQSLVVWWIFSLSAISWTDSYGGNFTLGGCLIWLPSYGLFDQCDAIRVMRIASIIIKGPPPLRETAWSSDLEDNKFVCPSKIAQSTDSICFFNLLFPPSTLLFFDNYKADKATIWNCKDWSENKFCSLRHYYPALLAECFKTTHIQNGSHISHRLSIYVPVFHALLISNWKQQEAQWQK